MVDRVLLGERSDGTYGLDVSLAGQEVYGATNSQLSFSSRQSYGGIIHISGTTTRGSTVNFTALDYVPMIVLGFYNGQQIGQYITQSTTIAGSGGNYNIDVSEPFVSITSSSFTCINLDTFTSSYPYNTVQYAVFRLPGGS